MDKDTTLISAVLKATKRILRERYHPYTISVDYEYLESTFAWLCDVLKEYEPLGIPVDNIVELHLNPTYKE